MPLSVEKFNLSHSLVTNKLKQATSLGIYVDIPSDSKRVDLSKFGLWDVSTPDFNTYYPDVTAEDLNPRDEEFAYPVFRALSEIIISKYGPVDFTKPGVLKKSMPLLVGQAMMTNHDGVVGSEVGVVIESNWEKKKSYGDYTLPAGINIKMKIDGKSNPKLVRSVMMDPPAVHSVSVTVAFKWDQSHDIPQEDFWRQLGTFDDKGVLIRRVVTEIVRYDEVSFVGHGADPFAQKIVDGTIVNPEYAKRVYQFSADTKDRHTHFIDWKNFDFSQLSLNNDVTIPSESKITNNNENQNSMKPEFLAFLIAQFALPTSTTEAEVVAKLNSELPNMIKSAGEIVDLKSKVISLENDAIELRKKYPDGTEIISKEQKEKLNKYDAMDAVMVKLMTSTQSETLRLYHLSVGGAEKGDEAITKLIASANFETLTSLAKQYSALVEKQFVAECSECHSHNITRASSINPELGIAQENGLGGAPGGKAIAKSSAEARHELFEKFTGGNKAGIHSQTEVKKK